MKNPDRRQNKSGPLSSEPRPHFTTSNPRQLRVVGALLTRPQPRKSVDCISGAANGPALIADLRKSGLEIPCVRVEAIDRDGHPCRPGVYYLTTADRRRVRRYQAGRPSA